MKQYRKHIVHRSQVPLPDEHYGIPAKPYVHQPGRRPDGADIYLVAGEPHRFDGKCHADCENVR